MSPEQRAAKFLFGFPDYTPNKPDHLYPLPDNPAALVSYNELVARFAKEDAGRVA